MGPDAVGNEATPEQLDAMLARCSHESLAAGGLGFSTTLVVHPLRRRRRAGRVALGLERRSARAVPRGQRARRHDARVRDRRMPARLLRRRSRADGRDDARRPAPAQLERAHDRLARAAALPRPGRARASTRERRAAPRSRSTMPTLVEMNMSFRNYCALFMLPGWSDVMNLPVPGAHREAARPRGAQVDERAGPLPRGRRVLPARVVGPLPDRRHLLRGERGPEGPDRRRPRRAREPRHVRHAASTS